MADGESMTKPFHIILGSLSKCHMVFNGFKKHLEPAQGNANNSAIKFYFKNIKMRSRLISLKDRVLDGELTRQDIH